RKSQGTLQGPETVETMGQIEAVGWHTIPEVLRGIHDEAGHQGQGRALSLARQRFSWVELESDTRDYVRRCQRCVVCKTPEPEGRAPLESIRTVSPLELVCINF
ncbi:hypothetical protein M9458_039607, partial [Cirrhinus mrigala]